MIRHVLFFLFFAAAVPLYSQVRVVCWNVENLFDTVDDTLTNDDDFTPRGANHWTQRLLEQKCNSIYKTLAAMGCPPLVALEEVENSRVLDALCLGTPLRKAHYRYLHHDSHDPRGIDCALLYRADRFHPFLSQPVPIVIADNIYPTRDILMVGGSFHDGDTLFLLVNHWPSQLGGRHSDSVRRAAEHRLSSLCDSLRLHYPTAWIVAVGDFNTTEYDPILQSLTNSVMRRLQPAANCDGSYKYQGRWQFIDHIFLSSPIPIDAIESYVFVAEWLLEPDPRYMGNRPFRTWHGNYLHGGVSDHQPLFVDLPIP